MTIPQAHRLRTESIALHRYFLNRKSNVHKGISLAEAIETSTANVLHIYIAFPSLSVAISVPTPHTQVPSWPPFSATFSPSTAATKEGSKSNNEEETCVCT